MAIDTIPAFRLRERLLRQLANTEGERELREAVEALRHARDVLARFVDKHDGDCDCRWCSMRAEYESLHPRAYAADVPEPVAVAVETLADVETWLGTLSPFLIIDNPSGY